MTVRISMQRDAYVGWNGRETPAREDVREFADHQAAANWLIYDSYFEEGYTRRLVWEVIDAVTATAPPPSGATRAPTYTVGGPLANFGVTRDGDLVSVRDAAGEVRPEFRPPVPNGEPRTSGPLDPEIHAALVRSVERGRREAAVRAIVRDVCEVPDCGCTGESHP